MTPAKAEAPLVERWTAGVEITELAQRLGIPKGTVQSRAHCLQYRGLIQSRPKGAHLGQRTKTRLTHTRAPVWATDRHPCDHHHEVMNSYVIIHEGTRWPKPAAT